MSCRSLANGREDINKAPIARLRRSAVPRTKVGLGIDLFHHAWIGTKRDVQLEQIVLGTVPSEVPVGIPTGTRKPLLSRRPLGAKQETNRL